MAYGETPIAKGAMYRLIGGQIADKFVFQFNPEEVKETLGVNWAYSESPGQYIPAAQFGSFQQSPVQFQLFLFGRESGEVSADYIDRQVARLQLFQSPGPEFSAEQSQFISPGRAKLIMGTRAWSGVVEMLDFSYPMFDRSFRPISAVVGVSFKLVSFGLQDEVNHLDRIRGRSGLSG